MGAGRGSQSRGWGGRDGGEKGSIEGPWKSPNGFLGLGGETRFGRISLPKPPVCLCELGAWWVHGWVWRGSVEWRYQGLMCVVEGLITVYVFVSREFCSAGGYG